MFNTILMAVDLNDTDGAQRLAEKGAQLAQLTGAELHLLNVVPDVGFNLVGAALGPDHSARMIAEAGAGLKDWATARIPEGVSVHLHTMQGTIYDQILKQAKALDVDAIVVGANRMELRDYLVGPNAARVVRHATQTVLVVR